MGRAVLISIKEDWVNRILNGSKTVEIRKTRPKLRTPFKCFIYRSGRKHQRGVVAEFTCDSITRLAHVGSAGQTPRIVEEGEDGLFHKFDPWDSVMTMEQIERYLDGRDGYAWNISDLVRFKEPKNLEEFEGARKTCFGFRPYALNKAPMGWCYVMFNEPLVLIPQTGEE